MRLRIHPRLFLLLPLLAMANSQGTNMTVAGRSRGKRGLGSFLGKAMKGVGGWGAYVRDIFEQPIKDLVNAGTRKLIEKTMYSNCADIGKTCHCGWGKCEPDPGMVAAGCCLGGYGYICCGKESASASASQGVTECKKKQTCECGWGQCVPDSAGADDDCCGQGFVYRCCEKAPSLLDSCKQLAAACDKCEHWGECHPTEGVVGNGCCQDGYSFRCCEKAPKKLTPCETLKTRCNQTKNHFGKCFPDEGSKGDACCAENFGLKCGSEMTPDEAMAVDPLFAQVIKCFLSGHPNWQSLVDCMPADLTNCNLCGGGLSQPDDELKCPRNVQCLLREIPDVDSLRKCVVESIDEDACNSPAPEFSTKVSKAQLGTGLLFAEGVPFVNVTMGEHCKELVDSFCPCKWASCVQREGYAKTNCCPDQFDLVCCATKAVPMQELIIAEKLEAAEPTTTTTTGAKTSAASSAAPSFAAALLIGCFYMFPNIYWAMGL